MAAVDGSVVGGGGDGGGDGDGDSADDDADAMKKVRVHIRD